MEAPKQSTTELTLRPLHDEEQTNESLEYLIGRIFADRGYFKNISEQSLQDEIVNKEVEKDEPSDDKADNISTTSKDPREQVYVKRAELLGYIRQAENEARLGLDFVSLLLSKDMPKQASMSMSPFLSKHVPPATLAIDKWETANAVVDSTQEQEVVAQGWTSKSLDVSATSLHQASSRLRQQVDKESRYWDQILSISQEGWSVTRAIRGSHLLEVRFSMREASPEFARRGSAILRPDEDGNIKLDHALNYNPKMIRVRVSQNGCALGSSHLDDIDRVSDRSIRSQLKLARDSLFEEELFHEIARESRILSSFNILMRDSTLYVPIKGLVDHATSDRNVHGQQLEISLVAAEDSNHNVQKLPWDQISQSIASFLRLLFCEAHRQKLRQRTQLPVPLSEGKRQVPPLPLLRPLLNHIQHYDAVQSTKVLLKSMQFILKSAGLEMDLNIKYDLMLGKITQDIADHNSEEPSVADRLTNQLMSPLHGTVTASLPSFSDSKQDRGSLDIVIYTHLASPTFGTTYRLKIPQSLAVILFNEGPVAKHLTFDKFADLSDYIYFLYEVDLAHHLVTMEGSGWVAEDKWPELSRSYGSHGAKNKLTVQFASKSLSLIVRSAEAPEGINLGLWDGSLGKDSFRVAVRQYTRSYPMNSK